MSSTRRTPSLLEMSWRNRLCPFEIVKKWKSGFSIKCPRETRMSWTSRKDEAINQDLDSKRVLDCQKCEKEMKTFFKREINALN